MLTCLHVCANVFIYIQMYIKYTKASGNYALYFVCCSAQSFQQLCLYRILLFHKDPIHKCRSHTAYHYACRSVFIITEDSTQSWREMSCCSPNKFCRTEKVVLDLSTAGLRYSHAGRGPSRPEPIVLRNPPIIHLKYNAHYFSLYIQLLIFFIGIFNNSFNDSYNGKF